MPVVQFVGSSLRWRLAAALGFGTLVLTGALAAATWSLVSDFMVEQQEQISVRRASVNSHVVEQALESDPEGVGDILVGMTADPERSVLFDGPDGWSISGRQVDPDSLTTRSLEAARSEEPVLGYVEAGGVAVLAVAVRVDGRLYIELFPLSQLHLTLRFLGVVLLAGVVTSVALAVALGFWASRRALRPLTELTATASRVAGGDLRARLPDQRDSDLAALARTFNRTADALEARVWRDARFASEVSHELRSPLTTMTSTAAVLRRRRPEFDRAAASALDLLLTEVDRFHRMVIDLLEISSNDQRSDSDPDSVEIVDLATLVVKVVEARPGAGPRLVLPDTPPLVAGDRRRLDRMVSNLLDNADEYAGGAVSLSLRVRGDTIRIEVDDDGPGVPEGLRERIFERFARGGGSGRRGTGTGTGLGLALVAQHAAWHGGAAHVENRPGGGARFVIELPAAPS